MHFNDYITTTKNQIQIAKVKHNLPDKPFYIAFTEWSAVEVVRWVYLSEHSISIFSSGMQKQ